MQKSKNSDKRRKYDAAFRAEALRLAGQSRSTQATARAPNINPKLLYRLAAASGGSQGGQ